MSEQIEAKAVEILTQIQGAVQAAGGVAVEQLPEIAQSYILYGVIKETSQVVFFLCVFLAFSLVGYKFAKQLDTCPHGEHSVTFACANVSALIAVLSGGIAMAEIGDMLLVWLAPKVWLIQKLAEMVK